VKVAGLALLGLVSLTVAGCQQPSVRPIVKKAEIDHAAEGHKAFELRDWGTAASHYRLALQKTPDELILHYRLAISTSWLDLRDEAATEFEWVVAHALMASEEARVAREWLAAARSGSTARAAFGEPDARDERVGDSGVHGRVVWDDGRGAAPLKRVPIHLYAQSADGPPKGVSFHIYTDRDGHYKFEKIPAGVYKLTDNNVGTPKWRLKIEVRTGEDALIDLGPENSVKMRDDFTKSS
jgi:hypothetical protein